MPEFTREEWDKLSSQEQWSTVYWLNTHNDDLSSVLKEIPECPQHGSGCTSHARVWVRNAFKTIEEAKADLAKEYPKPTTKTLVIEVPDHLDVEDILMIIRTGSNRVAQIATNGAFNEECSFLHTWVIQQRARFGL
jgi:hypothetical protein